MKPRHFQLPPGTCREVGGILSTIGAKWSVFVIVALSDGDRRFGELKRAVESVSQKMLTVTLRALERDGFVTRTVTPTVPPRVDYALTALGRSVLVPIQALAEWAIEHRDAVQDSRADIARRDIKDAMVRQNS